MSKQSKRVFRMYAAWNYQKQIDDLNSASDKGWQLVKVGVFSCKFIKNSNLRYRYQIDYNNVTDMGRYIETFREQGWEYVNSTFNGWHYFRKLYDPSQPEEAYEIFTDRQSLEEMNRRWARFVFIIGAIEGLVALAEVIWCISKPRLPSLILAFMCVLVSVFLIRGGLIMRNPDSAHRRKGSAAFLPVLLGTVIICSTLSCVLMGLRPNFSMASQADSISAPMVDNRLIDFEVRYPDNYYLDVDIDADAPVTISVLNAEGNMVYTVTEKSFHENGIRLWLPAGKYWVSSSYESGYEIKCSLD